MSYFEAWMYRLKISMVQTVLTTCIRPR